VRYRIGAAALESERQRVDTTDTPWLLNPAPPKSHFCLTSDSRELFPVFTHMLAGAPSILLRRLTRLA